VKSARVSNTIFIYILFDLNHKKENYMRNPLQFLLIFHVRLLIKDSSRGKYMAFKALKQVESSKIKYLDNIREEILTLSKNFGIST
jgi:hypothetical protein